MSEREVGLEVAGSPMEAYVAEAAGEGSAPGVIVAMEAFGVNAHVRDVCRRLAAEGYVAVAPDFYHRETGPRLFDYGDFEAVRPALQRLSNEGIEADARAALDYLRRHPRAAGQNVGVVGFCVGGFMAVLAACRLDLSAAVCFYGGGIVRERPNARMRPVLAEIGRLRGPLLALFGGKDASIPAEDVERLRSGLASAGKTAEIAVYPEAGHGFFCDARPAAFHAASAADAWRRTLDWLARYVRG